MTCRTSSCSSSHPVRREVCCCGLEARSQRSCCDLMGCRRILAACMFWLAATLLVPQQCASTAPGPTGAVACKMLCMYEQGHSKRTVHELACIGSKFMVGVRVLAMSVSPMQVHTLVGCCSDCGRPA